MRRIVSGRTLRDPHDLSGILINFFGTFSQVLSDSREERGSQGILLYWSSAPILLLINLAI